jgi:hypothetical protein
MTAAESPDNPALERPSAETHIPAVDTVTTLSDREFRDMVASKDGFSELIAGHPDIMALAQVEHSVDPVDLLTHTRHVLERLDTAPLADADMGELKVSPIELVRLAALFHDTDKLPDIMNDKAVQAERAVEAIGRTDAHLFESEAEADFFKLLLATCDYYGYNIGALDDGKGADKNARIEDIVERKIRKPLDAFYKKHRIYPDEETVARMQYAVSAADTASIPAFRKNLPLLEKLRDEILKRL